MSKSRYMNFLGILSSHPAVARKRHISCFSLLLYENRLGIVSDMYPQYWVSSIGGDCHEIQLYVQADVCGVI